MGGVAPGLGHQHQLFLALEPHPGRCRAAWSQRWMAGPGGALNVLGVQVAAAHNDQALDPAAHGQLPAMQGPKVASAQVLRVVALEGGLERLVAQLRLAPIAPRLAGPAHPDFTHHTRSPVCAPLGVDNDNAHAAPGHTAAHQLHTPRAHWWVRRWRRFYKIRSRSSLQKTIREPHSMRQPGWRGPQYPTPQRPPPRP